MIPNFLTNETFINDFKSSIIKHHNIYDWVIINGIIHEEIFFKACLAAGFFAEWTCGSHKPGSDVTVIVNKLHEYLISCKGGKINKKNESVTISSHRTTEHKTIEEKMSFLNDIVHQDGHCSLIYMGEHEYRYYWIPNNICKIDNFIKKIGPKGGVYWGGSNDFNVSGRIAKSMSDQLWLDIPLEHCIRIF